MQPGGEPGFSIKRIDAYYSRSLIADFPGSKFLYRLKPVLLGRTSLASSRLPKFVRTRGDFIVPKRDHAVTGSPRLRMVMGINRVFEFLPRVFVTGQMILFAVLLFG